MYRLTFLICTIFISVSSYGNTSDSLSSSKKFAYHSEEGKVNITFPSEYEVNKEETSLTHKVTASSKNDGHTYRLIFTIHSQGLSEFLEDGYAFCERSFKVFTNSLGTTIEQKDYQYQGIKGLQATVRLPDQGGVAHCKSIFKDMILYQIVTITASKAISEDAERFFNSFKLTK